MNMLKTTPILLLLLGSNSYSQLNQLPLPEVIKRIKPYIVAIEAKDDTILTILNADTTRFQSYGSGVFVGFSQNDIYAITNEHVIAIKDSMDKTIRYANEIKVSINVRGLGAVSFPAKIRKISEHLDLAALRVFTPTALRDSIDVMAMPPTLWEEEKNLQEGDVVLYTGYPLLLGRGQKNYPLTRWGMISQIIPGDSTFLIDAFVQPGYSGSPVFLIRSVGNNIPTQWTFRFVGLTSSYPYRFMPIYRKVQYIEIPNIVVPENPGFSIVVGISALKHLFNLTK
jgi:S1-C subfamily serine protease